MCHRMRHMLLIWVGLVIGIVTAQQQTLCKDGRADIIFLLDESSSVTISDFAKAQQFLKSFMEAVIIGQNDYQIGLVRFSDLAKTVFKLNTQTTKSEMVQAIDALVPLGGATNTSGALREAVTLLSPANGNRGDVLDVVIIITDGVDNVEEDRTAYEASLTRMLPSRIFAIGVGPAIDIKELNALATDPNDFHLYDLSDYTMLDSIVEDLVLKTCFQQGCGLEESDIVLILDISGSIEIVQFEETISFIKSIVNDLDIGPTKSRLGLVTFATDVNIKFTLDRYNNKADILAALDTVTHSGGSTATVQALNTMRTRMFTLAAGDRPNHPNTAFIITDGSSKDGNPSTEARLSREKGIQIYAIGITTVELNIAELTDIASDPKQQHLFFVDDFAELASLRGTIACLPPLEEANTIAPPSTESPASTPAMSTATPTVQPPECRRGRADVVFVLDSSGSISDPNFILMKEFIQNIVLSLDISNTTTRVGAMSFSDAATQNFALNQYFSRFDAAAAVGRIDHEKGSTATVAALRLLREVMFTQENGDRPNVPNIAIFITDGSSKDGAPKEQAKLAHDAGIKIFCIAVESQDQGIRPEEFADIASDPDSDYLFNIDTFDALPEIKKGISEGACIRTPICQDGVADITLLLDVSGSVEKVQSNVLLAARALVEDLNIRQDGQRVASVSFSDEPKVEWLLTAHNDVNTLVDAIDSIESVGGATNIAHAISTMESQVFQKDKGDRSNVTNVAVLITDGVSTVFETQTIAQAIIARRNGTGTLIFALGIGPGVDEAQLRLIATPPYQAHMFIARDINELYDATESMAKHACFKKVQPSSGSPSRTIREAANIDDRISIS
ncbi:unnamed protein product [Owenia fusiformis]|uniref:Uncharacterized protein n=1 Tax=Owenia fusiformis TaxID=6347 RepID=A0A8J1TSQ5_OWEFU|nr:unnamed protein product [Owenia fusiformis]